MVVPQGLEADAKESKVKMRSLQLELLVTGCYPCGQMLGADHP